MAMIWTLNITNFGFGLNLRAKWNRFILTQTYSWKTQLKRKLKNKYNPVPKQTSVSPDPWMVGAGCVNSSKPCYLSLPPGRAYIPAGACLPHDVGSQRMTVWCICFSQHSCMASVSTKYATHASKPKNKPRRSPCYIKRHHCFGCIFTAPSFTCMWTRRAATFSSSILDYVGQSRRLSLQPENNRAFVRPERMHSVAFEGPRVTHKLH